MKYFTFLLFVLLLVSCSEDQDKIDNKQPDVDTLDIVKDSNGKKIPKVVTDEFNKKFPDAENVTWEFDEGAYEAEFLMGTMEFESEFDKEGVWISTENEIPIERVPEKAINAVNETYMGLDIMEADSVESREYGTVYEVEIKRVTERGEEKLGIYVDKNGNIMKVEQEDVKLNADESE